MKSNTTHHASVSLWVFISDRFEHAIPVGSAIVGRCTQRCDGILFGTNVLNLHCPSVMGGRITKEGTHNDVVHVVLLNLGSKINIDFNPILRVLFFNRVK